MSTHQITFRDWVLRTWLELKSNMRYIFKFQKTGIFKITSDYKLKFYEDFKQDYHYNWDNAAEWGIPPYHPDNMNQWYDPEQVTQNEEGVNFNSVVKPHYFEELDTTIPNAVNMLRTKDSWKYGIFIFSAKLSSGTYLWPALWVCGRWSWPPEIDLLEAYSDDTTDYYKNKKLQSNVHMNCDTGGIESAGARTHRLPNKVTENFIEYVLWWEKDFIKMYYNGYLVRKITDKEILDKMFEDQRIIIGSGIQVGFTTNNISPVVVNKVAVYQK